MDAEFAKGLGGDPVAVIGAIFERQKAFAEHAFEQLDDEGFFKVLAPGLNSVAVIARHIASNLASRWTDFLTTDGEKSTRNRDAELAALAPDAASRSAIRAGVMRDWEAGWATLFATLDTLSANDLERTVLIRSKPHSAFAAALRQIDHYSFHVGQINIIARQIVGTANWHWFTVPPGGTAALNSRLMGG
ncbi:MAG: DUF1572 family protein [Planctomycetota bacterium]